VIGSFKRPRAHLGAGDFQSPSGRALAH
jgi:hypothetical protein